MQDLTEQLSQCLKGRVCLMGLGNVDYGDDGFGVYLAEKLIAAGVPDVVVAAATPERFIGSVTDGGFDNLVFLDAVEFGGLPGSVVLLNGEEMASRFPQVSTHKISLGLMAKWIEDNGKTKAYLLGIQPESLKGVGGLTPTLLTTLELLSGLLCELRNNECESHATPLPCEEAEAPTTEVTI